MMLRFQAKVSFLLLVTEIFILNAALDQSDTNVSDLRTAFAIQATEISDLLQVFTTLIEKADKYESQKLDLPEITTTIPSNLESVNLEELFDRFETAAQSLRTRFLKYLKTAEIPSSNADPEVAIVPEFVENRNVPELAYAYEYSSSTVDSDEGSGVSSDDEPAMTFILSDADASELQPEYRTSTVDDAENIDSSKEKSSVAFVVTDVLEPAISVDYMTSTVIPIDNDFPSDTTNLASFILSEAEKLIQDRDKATLLEEKSEDTSFAPRTLEYTASLTDVSEIPTEPLDHEISAALNSQSESSSEFLNGEATLVLESTEDENAESLFLATDGSYEVIMTTFTAADESPEYVLTTLSTYSENETMEIDSFTEDFNEQVSEAFPSITEDSDEGIREVFLSTTENFDKQVSEGILSSTEDSDEQESEKISSTTEDSDEQVSEGFLPTTEDSDEQVSEGFLPTTEDSDEQVNEKFLVTTEDVDEVKEELFPSTEKFDDEVDEEFLPTSQDSDAQIGEIFLYTRYPKEFSKRMYDQPVNSHLNVVGVPGKDYPNYTNIPATTFACAQRKGIGFYADLETGCQVFHACWPHRVESYLCPVGSTFNQEILSCDYWYNSICNPSTDNYEANLRLKAYLTEVKDGLLDEFTNDKYPYNFQPDLTHPIFSAMKFQPFKYVFKHYSTKGRGMKPGGEIDQNETVQIEFDQNSTLPNIEDFEHQETTDDMVDSVKDGFRELLKSFHEATSSKNAESSDDFDESSDDSLYRTKLEERKYIYEKMSKSSIERSDILSKASDAETTTLKESENSGLFNKKTHSKTGKDHTAPEIAFKVLETAENVFTKGILPITRELMAANYIKLYKAKKL